MSSEQTTIDAFTEAGKEALLALQTAMDAWGQRDFPADQVQKAKLNLEKALGLKLTETTRWGDKVCIHQVKSAWCPHGCLFDMAPQYTFTPYENTEKK